MPPRSPDTLTPMQWRVLERLAAGRQPEGIARDLGLAVGTVKAHIGGIYQRLPIGRAANKRAAAIAWYRRETLQRETTGESEE